MTPKFVSAVALTMMFAVPATAQVVTASDPRSVMSALQDLGYRAELTTDSDGDPKIRSAIDGTNYSIYFYGCRDNTDCRWIQFSTGWDLSKGTTLQAMNEWNRTKLFGEATLDSENDPHLSYFFTLDGGMSRPIFDDTVDWWGVAIREFKDYINW